MSFFQELRRRNVFKVGIAYAVSTWVILQLVDVMSEILELPVWAPKLVLLLLLVGFVPALIIAWAFELTPEGIKLESEVDRSRSTTPRTGRKLDYVIMSLLGLSLAYFIWESRYKDELAEVAANPVVDEAENPDTGLTASNSEAVTERRNAIAVLPFANRSDQDSDQFFTDGIHDDLLTQLSKVDAFSVISRTSVMEYRDTAKNLKEIADELDVAHVMEGAVQRAGDRVRINVQLIDADTDEHLWAEIYDRQLTTENLFDIQSEIAQAIAGALEATLTDQEIASVGDAPTSNLEAYQLYLQAKQFTLGQTLIGYQQALSFYEEALRLDPDFALAWIGKADAHITNFWNYGGNVEDRDKSAAAIEKARTLAPDIPELAMIEGAYWYWGYLDYDRALYHLNRALKDIPGNARAWMLRGWAYRRSGDWEQAIASMERGIATDPRASFYLTEYASTLVALHRFESAEQALKRAAELDPNSYWTKSVISELAVLKNGDTARAARETIGFQHSPELGAMVFYMNKRFLDRRFEEALQSAEGMSRDVEIQLANIHIREQWLAWSHRFMGNEEAAKAATDAAWFRLEGLQQQLGDDYRLLHAKTIVAALRGDPPEDIRAMAEISIAARPKDAYRNLDADYEIAQAFAIAGMTDDVVAFLSPRLGPPSFANRKKVSLDPAFDSIRRELAFTSMMEAAP